MTTNPMLRGDPTRPLAPSQSDVRQRLYAESRRLHERRARDETRAQLDPESRHELIERDAARVGADLNERSLTDLRAIARHLDIPGRSKMEHDELVEAIRAVYVAQHEGGEEA